jgi:hypothetical protein
LVRGRGNQPPCAVGAQDEESMVFFEKKNQKLLSVGVRPRSGNSRQVVKAKEQKFFASFFQKRRPSCLH